MTDEASPDEVDETDEAQTDQAPPDEVDDGDPPPNGVGDRGGPAHETDDAPPHETDEERRENRYKRRVAITLAVLATLGAWIAILQTNAATNESRTAREATRLGAASQAAAVVEAGALAARDQQDIEVRALAYRSPFDADPAELATEGIDLDPDATAARQADAEKAVEEAIGGDGSIIEGLQYDSRRLALTQTFTVDARITWNARASQYETVMTTLGVAIFLIGFTVVVTRRVRPPLAVPGLALAFFCFGWAVYIHQKPIPKVSEATIEATALGQTAFANAKYDDAVTAFDTAVSLDDSYQPAFEGRALTELVAANPDLLNTSAFTDTDAAVLDPVRADVERALDLNDGRNTITLTVAAYAAVGAGDWDLAADHLEAAIALNDLTPGLQFALSAVEVARGNGDAAEEWRRQAVDRLGPLEETDRNRTLVSQYYSLLEWVAHVEPERADTALAIETRTIVGETTLAAGRDLTGEVPDGAEPLIDSIQFGDQETTIDLSSRGIPDDAVVTLVGYERPSDGGPWVQPVELFYVGPPGRDNSAALTISTPRACAPTAYRFDFYVEGVLVGQQDEPGVAATC